MVRTYDFVIFGASRLAALLSGLLAHDHRQQVLRVADPVPKMRLSRSIDLGLPLATRPATWRLFREGAAETARLFTEIDGSGQLDRATVKIVADLPATVTALAHMAHVAAGYGFAAVGGVFRDVPRLVGEIDLTSSDVQTVESHRVMLSLAGSRAELTLDGEPLPAGMVVLADDAAILDLLAETERPTLLEAEPMLATLTMPAKRLAAQVVHYPDRGVTLVQRADRSVLALVTAGSNVEARLASCLSGPFPLPRRATTHYRRLVTRDGAPLIGRRDGRGLAVIAGLGSAAAFFAPALARLLAGRAGETEAAWFAAHDPSCSSRASVADFSEVRP